MSEGISWWWKVVLGARCSVYMIPWLTHLIVADIILSALLPVSAIFPTLGYNVSSYIAESVWRGIQFIFTRINRASIVVSGVEKLPQHESAIVISNHVEWTDFYMIQELAIHAGMLGRCRWFAKQQLRWVPFLGWGLWAMGMPLVSRKWMTDEKEMDRVFRGVLQRNWPIWLVSFSEATRYTTSKRLEAEAWCRANNKTLPQHTLYPRTKGFVACVQMLRSAAHVKAVYDITVAYAKKNGRILQQPPTFPQSITYPSLDEKWRFFVHVERYAIEDLPKTNEEIAEWLEERWIEKGDHLEILEQKMQKGLPWEPF